MTQDKKVWTPEEWVALSPDRRTSEVKKAIALGIQSLEGSGKDPRMVPGEVVPLLAYQIGLCPEPTVLSLAETLGVHRSSLSNCLSASRKLSDIRGQLDFLLGLTEETVKPGGMSLALKVLEGLR